VTPARLLLLGLLTTVCSPLAARAQARPRPRAEIPGLDFRRDGVWRRQARQIRANRARLLARRRFSALNAPLAGGGGAPLSPTAPSLAAAAVSGVLRVPAILFRFKDTPAGQIRTAAQYDQILFAATPPSGRPYTYRSYYEQMSNGLLSVQGKSYGYAALDSNEITYAGTPPCTGNPYPGSSNCNGLFDNGQTPDPLTRMQNGLREALRKVDNQVDWTQYDSDGDTFVDLVVFIHPPLGGECGGPSNNHLWAHRFVLTGSPFFTHSKNAAGTTIKVADYTLQSGVGGEDGCDGTQIMPVGTVAHETGHGFGLPDLYDTADSSEGIGEYSLMSSGNYTSPFSPSRMDAWSLNELGWVTVVPLLGAGTYSFGAAPTSDTAFYLPVLGSNPRGEYFLLENRQQVQSDSAMIHFHCQLWYDSGTPPPECGGGLLIYHVDSAQLVAGVTTPGPNDDFNHVNVGPIHGLAVVQADAFGNLDADPNANRCPNGPISSSCSDRGDAGDPYPGTTSKTTFSATTVPAALRNADGRPVGFQIDQIAQVVPNGRMSFRLAYPVWVVRAETDTAAVIQVDGVYYNVYRELLDPGTILTVSVADTQYTASGRTRQVFGSWSDGGLRSHTFTTGASPETLTVTLARSHQLTYTATSGGTVTPANVADTSGSFFADGTAVTLAAASGSQPFVSWAGDTASKNAQITLPMGRPYTVRAVFFAPLNTADVVAQILNGTSALTAQQLADLDQLGNGNGPFDLGDFLAWVQATGAPLAAEQRGVVRARQTKGAPR
jgi:M6 family metalloprotease-like protein